MTKTAVYDMNSGWYSLRKSMKLHLFQRRINYHYIIILIYSIVAHGLLLLNDGVYFDGWLIYTNLVGRNWENLYLIAMESGNPLFAYFHWFMGYFPATIFSYKLVAFLSITLSGILVYAICSRLRITSRTESLLIAILSVVYPAYQVSVELIHTYSLVLYCLFFLACFLALISEKRSGATHYALRVGALILWVLSFSHNALLVFYYGFLIVFILYAKKERGISLKNLFTRFLLRRLDYVLFPLVYWGVFRIFFQPHGLYAGYNQMILSPLSILFNYVRFMQSGVYTQLDIAFKYLNNYPALVIIGLLVLYYLLSVFVWRSIRPPAKDARSWLLLLFGLVLLGLAILPFAIVGKYPNVHGWGTRHALLLSLPMAIIFVAIGRICFIDKTASISRLGIVFLVILTFIFTASSIANYLSWQARWVKDQSVMINLPKLKDAEDISIFWVDDQTNLDGEEYYRFYEWSSMFKTMYGDESRIGLEIEIYPPDFLSKGQKYFNQRYNLTDFNPAGRQAVLTIRRSDSLNYEGPTLAYRYLWYRYFNKDKLDQFLEQVTDLQLQPIPVSGQ
jgi:hypothetical protein